MKRTRQNSEVKVMMFLLLESAIKISNTNSEQNCSKPKFLCHSKCQLHIKIKYILTSAGMPCEKLRKRVFCIFPPFTPLKLVTGKCSWFFIDVLRQTRFNSDKSLMNSSCELQNLLQWVNIPKDEKKWGEYSVHKTSVYKLMTITYTGVFAPVTFRRSDMHRPQCFSYVDRYRTHSVLFITSVNTMLESTCCR